MAKYRNSRFLTLKDVLDDMIGEMRIGGKMDEMNVRKYWHELMGAYVSNHTSRIYYRDGKLFVTMDSSAIKQELFMAREKIRTDLNKRMEKEVITELILR